MNLKMKLLDLTLIGILATGAVASPALQAQGVTATDTQGRPALVRAGRYAINLPGGGVVWATEDPTLAQARLSVMTGGTAPFESGRIVEPVRFSGSTNYPAFIERSEVAIYRENDADLVSPIAKFALSTGSMPEGTWDGSLPSGLALRTGDVLRYVVRAYGRDGAVDETYPQTFQLVSPQDHARGVKALRVDTERARGESLSGEQAQSLALQGQTQIGNALRQQNIAIQGSRVRILGRDVPSGTQLTINGEPVALSQERAFAAEYLQPIGMQTFEVTTRGSDGPRTQTLSVDVTGRYLFLVAIADVTLSQSSGDDNIEPLAGDERFEDGFLTEGRLAFYLKGKVRGKYLITAQADTRERELDRLFTGFLDAAPNDIFRRLDPDAY